MIYTRYLYDKPCVEYSLFISLLQENKDEALFWGLELFHSGFSEEIVTLIWKYYYTLYAPFYINLESHLSKYTNLWLKNKSNDSYIATMINSLSTRNACVDFDLTYKCVLPPPKRCEVVFNCIDESDNLDDIMNAANGYITEHKLFITRGKNAMLKVNTIFETFTFLDINIYRIAIKSRLLSGIFLRDKNNKYDPKNYVIKEKKDILNYKTKPVIELKGWKIPKRECLYQLKLKPSTNTKDIYNYDYWLYYASRSPLWRSRISRHNGTIHNENKTITFSSVENEETFYNLYNYEPDEQSMEVQSKWTGKREYKSWGHIYETHKCEPYNEWFVKNNT